MSIKYTKEHISAHLERLECDPVFILAELAQDEASGPKVRAQCAAKLLDAVLIKNEEAPKALLPPIIMDLSGVMARKAEMENARKLKAEESELSPVEDDDDDD